MDENVKELLLSLVETSRQDNYNMDVVMAKFPELQQVDQDLLMSFVETARKDNFNMEGVFAKFPEITGELEEEQTQDQESGYSGESTIYYGTPAEVAKQKNKKENGKDGEKVKGGKKINRHTSFQVGDLTGEYDELSNEYEYYNIPVGDRDYSSIKTEKEKLKVQADMDAEQLLGGMSHEKKVELFGKNYSNQTKSWQIAVLAGLIQRDGYEALGLDTGEAMYSATIDDILTKDQKTREYGDNYDADNIDLNDFSTVVNQTVADVQQAFDSSADYPGLRIISTGGTGDAVRFILPDGSEVPVNLSPTTDYAREVRSLVYGTAEDEGRQILLDAERDKLQKVRDWYKENDSRENIGLFRILGKRDDALHLSGMKTWFDDLDAINTELKVVNMKITSPTLGRYFIENAETEELLHKGNGAQGVQKWLWNNLDEADLSALRDSITKMTVDATNVYRGNRKRIYEDVIDRSPEELLLWGLDNVVGTKAWQGEKVVSGGMVASDLIKQAAVEAGISGATIDLLLSEEWLGNKARSGQSSIEDAIRFQLRTMLDNKDRYGRDKGTSLTIPLNLKSKIPADELTILENLFNSDENGYTGILTEDVIKEQALSMADERTATYFSTLGLLDDSKGDQYINEYDAEGNLVLDANGDPKRILWRPEANSATIDDFRRDSNYLDEIASKSDGYLNATGSYTELFKKYQKAGDKITENSKTELNGILKQIEKAGLGYTSKNGVIVVEGLDEDKVNKYQRLLNDHTYNSRKLGKQWSEGYDSLIADYKTLQSDAFDLGVITDKEYDKWDLLRDDFWGGFQDMGANVQVLLGSDQGTRYKESKQRGSEYKAASLTYEEAAEAGLGWRFAQQTIAQQGANVVTAIGVNIVLPGAGSWLVPTIFGAGAGGEKRFQLEQQIDAGEMAKLQLADLERQYNIGVVSEEEYKEVKGNLLETQALGDIDSKTLWGSVASAAIIEGGISYFVGTNPNAKNAIAAMKGSVDDIASAITTQTWKRGFQSLGKTTKEIGGEILEEELIWAASNLADGYWLGTEADWSQWDDIAVTSILTSGPMSGSSNFVNFAKSQYVTKTERQSYFEGKQELADLHKALQNVDLKDTQTIALYQEKIRKVVRSKLAYADNSMEANVIVNGVKGLEQMVRASAIESDVNRKAGIKPEMSLEVKKAKMDAYKKTLSKSDAKDLDTKLGLIQETRDNITKSTETTFEREALGDNGLIQQHLGNRGTRIANKLSKNNPEFNKMSNRDKFIAVHDASKKQFQEGNVNEMRNDSDVKRHVEEQIYGKGGFDAAKKDGKRKNRKKKLETQYYEHYASKLLAKRTDARVTYDKQSTNASDILSKKELENVQIIEKANIKEIQNYHVDNWEDMGYTSPEAAERAVAEFVDKDGKVVVDDFGSITIGKNGKPTYLTLNAEKAKQKLKDGKVLQGTVFSHEISHIITEMALTDVERNELAENVFESMQSTAALRRLSTIAVYQMSSETIVDEARLKLKDPSKEYNPDTNPALPMDQQTPLAAEEYVHRVQDLLQDPSNEGALKEARKSSQGLGNLLRSTYGGNFNFKSKGAGLNYIAGYIDAFAKGEISRQAKRKITHFSPPVLTDEQIAEKNKNAKPGETLYSQDNKKEASDRVTALFDKGDIPGIINEYDGINTDDAAIAKRKGQNVERKKSQLETILKPYAKVAGFNMEDGKMALITHPRGLLGLLQEYDNTKGVPVAAWVNKYLKERAKEVIGTIGADGVITVDIDSPGMVGLAVDENTGVSEIERRGKGVKLWTRFGSEGAGIHNSIMADVVNGDIKVDGKNYKTLGGKRFYQVMEMMGINPVNKAGKPKSGNLDATDVTNAQRWAQKHISEIRSAIIPQHSTVKMVKNPDTGKLESRPDKAIGIPGVLLNSDLFTKNTRKDNLTGYSFNDSMLDSEILAMFGVTPKGEPNLNLKDDRNIGQKIRALVKLTDMAMTNQGARVAMENRGDPISEVLHVADGRSLNLYSQDTSPDGSGISEMLQSVPLGLPGFQDQVVKVAEIAMETVNGDMVGYDTDMFKQRVKEEGISQVVLDYVDDIGYGEYFSDTEQNLVAPLKAKVGNGTFEGKAATILSKFFKSVIMSKDARIAKKARKQLAAGATHLIKTMDAADVKALGKPFFGMLGSKRGLNIADNKAVYDLYDKKTKGVTANPNIVQLNANKKLMLNIQKILVDPNLNAKQKEALVNKLYGKDIKKAKTENKKVLKRVTDAMAKAPDEQTRLGIMQQFKVGSSNVMGIRSLTSLDAIQYSDKPQAMWRGVNKKTGQVVYFPSSSLTPAQKANHGVELNVDHPNYAEALKDAKRRAQKKLNSRSKAAQLLSPTTPAMIEAETKAIMESPKDSPLRFKGEHITPSANSQRMMLEALMNHWYTGKSNLSADIEAISSNFAQSLAAKVYSDMQDNKLGTTSTADQIRLLSVKGDIDIDALVDTEGGKPYSSYLTEFLASRSKIQEVIDNLSDTDNTKKQELREGLKSIVDKDTTPVEVAKAVNDSRKANNLYSQDTTPKGMTAWDFDDTLATTKSNVIFTKDGETKIVSAEDFAKQGADLTAEGWAADFSEFNEVTDGKPGPMFDKAMERAKKYGTGDTYILTARNQEAAPAIKEFLDALGLDIPIENITGLGNSTGEAKARWLLDKHAQGYNDIAFADDALQNIKAVKDVFNEYDIKGKVELAKQKFSQDVEGTFVNEMLAEAQSEIDLQFNTVLSETKGVDAAKEFSAVKAKQRGKDKGRFKFFLPPSAEDFKGLMYSFMGKGAKGEAHQKFFKENLFDPFSKGMRRLNSMKHEISSDIRGLKKGIPGIKKKLRTKVGDTNFTNESAVRVYNWVKNGVDVPGLSQTDQTALVKAVENDADLMVFAGSVQDVSNKIGTVQSPGNAWLAGTVSSDISDQMNDSRGSYLQEWSNNTDVMFSEKNLNKIEAIYGSNFRESLEDIVYRMKTGSTRNAGSNRMMNNFTQWINGSVGTTMFFNARSAMLQMISNVNFINWHDNNPIKAAKVFANQKQYWGDVAMIFNSPYLKQRRSGIGTDLNAAELLKDLKESPNAMKTFTAHLLQLGFTPTQIADSMAIATGGATMYRNRIQTHMDNGMTKSEAESQAFLDMQEIAEETQQSARPDKISQQQASPLGKLILAFQNTPMQYNRIMKRAMQDMVNGRGDNKAHVSKIIYYGGVQSMIFYGLQTAMFSALFGDDDEEDMDKKQGRVVNGMMDSILRGAGIGGAIVATTKNTILKFMEQDAKNEDGEFYTDPNHAYTILEALNLSPPIGIKARKLYGATQTWQFNRDVIDHMSKTDMDNPIYDATFSATEALTNIPLSRLYNKVQNIKEAMDSDNETWQRVAMLMGWSRWSFGIQNQDVMTAKGEVKEIKAAEAEVRADQRQAERDAERVVEEEAIVQENIATQEEERQAVEDAETDEEREEAEENVTCAAVSRSGNRCSNNPVGSGAYCTVHEEVEQTADGEKSQCSHVKDNGDQCKMQTSNKSGKCYYHD